MSSHLAEHGPARALLAGRGRGPGHPVIPLFSHASRCPVPGCGERIDASRLMCKRDWYLVPKVMRDRVWRTWRSGQGAHSRAHREAVRKAIAASQLAGGPAPAHSGRPHP
jgi:hypothetical protein